jgi:PAS domain-containing protein
VAREMTATPEDHTHVSDGDILIADEVARRPARSPDLAAENDALHALARLLIDDPDALPRQLAEIALELCDAGSAGVSLLEETRDGTVFRWTALAGRFAPYEGGSTPRNFSPCGLCLDRGEPILVAYPARRFRYLNDVDIPIVEGLVLPLYGAGKRPLGTLWIVAHMAERQFDREDVRVMTRLADFAALAIENAAVRAEVTKGERLARELLDALPAAIYTTDAAGRVTYCNGAAADLAGRKPRLGYDEWCVTWRLYQPDGTPLPVADCPMAVALKEDRPVRGKEVIAERPDRTRVSLMSYPTPLHDSSGKLIGAVNMLVDITERKRAEASVIAQRRILEMVATGTPLTNTLDELMRFIEAREPEARCGLLIVGEGLEASAA